MWIFLLVEYSKGSHFYYYDTMEAISTNALLLRQWKKNNEKRLIKDTIYASSIFSCSALNFPAGTYYVINR